MQVLIRRLFAVVVLIPIGSAVSADEANDDLSKLQGEWKAITAINNGEKVIEADLGVMIFSGNEFTGKGKRTLAGTFILDSSRSPKHIDMQFRGGNGAIHAAKAIYKIEGNRLTICAAEIGESRPAEFQSVAGTKKSLVVLVKTETLSAEMQVLSQFVGKWHGKAVTTDANGNKSTSEDDAEMRWILGNSYLEDKIGDSLYGLWTYDAQKKVYRVWYFLPNTHQPTTFVVTWNSADSAFTGNADLGNGLTMATRHKFVGIGEFEWSARITDAGGNQLTMTEGTKTRK